MDASELSLARDLVVLFGIPFDNVSMDEAIKRIDGFVRDGRPHYVATANVNFVVMAHKDPEFMEVVRMADMITVDGMPIVWAAKLFNVRLKGRVTGSDLTPRLAALAAEKGYKIFFLGGEAGVGEIAADNLRKAHPGLQVGCYSPEFNPLLEMNNSKILARVKEFAPDMLFVSFGAGKAEKWIRMNLKSLQVPVCAGVGATIDFLAGRVSRAPIWMQRSGLEWGYRLMQEPRRMWRRYGGDMLYFSFRLLSQWVDYTRQKTTLPKRSVAAVRSIPFPAKAPESDKGYVLVKGRLDRSNATELLNIGQALLREQKYLVADLSQAAFVDSSGLGALAALEKIARENNAVLVLAAPSEAARRTITVAKMESFFSIGESIEDAYSLAVKKREESVALHPVNPSSASSDHKEQSVVGCSLALEGRIDANTVDDFRSRLFAALKKNTEKGDVELDFEQVSFIDSSGLAVVILASKWLNREGNKLYLKNVGGAASTVFKLMKMDNYLNVKYKR